MNAASAKPAQQMLRSAHTVEQYKIWQAISRAPVGLEEKRSKKLEWERRSQITAASYQKYPVRRTRHETVTSTSRTKPADERSGCAL